MADEGRRVPPAHSLMDLRPWFYAKADKMSKNFSESTDENRRQAGSGDDAGTSGFCLGTVRRIEQAPHRKGA